MTMSVSFFFSLIILFSCLGKAVPTRNEFRHLCSNLDGGIQGDRSWRQKITGSFHDLDGYVSPLLIRRYLLLKEMEDKSAKASVQFVEHEQGTFTLIKTY